MEPRWRRNERGEVMRTYKTASEFYTSKEWRKLRQMLMSERVNASGEITCAECGKPIIKGYDCIAHHIKEINATNLNDPSVTLNPLNILLVHMKCHNKIHNRFGGRVQTWQRKVYYVYGAPCSGKSTFVRENMQSGDLVLDIDRLWSALSGQPEYVKPNELKPVVFNARNAIMDSIKTRAGNWQTAWVIEGGAFLGDRMRRIETLGAESIFIEATRDECIQRLASDEKRRSVQDEWIKYIDEWFNNYQPDAIIA